MTITIKTDLLLAVSKWAMDDDHRPHMRVVLFKNDELIACDGKRLVRVPVACYGLTVAFDRDMVAAAAAVQACCKDSAPRDPEYRGNAVEISMTKGQVAMNLGRFTLHGPAGDASACPPYDKVMPNERPERHPDGYGFSAAYLAAIDEVEKAAGNTGGTGLKVTGWSADGLGAMLFEGHMGIRYVVMPMRV